MAIRLENETQTDLIMCWADVPRPLGHASYGKLQKRLVRAGLDQFAEDRCKAYHALRMGAPSVPSCRYFRMLLTDYLERIHGERGIGWRCSDSVSLREFLRLPTRKKVPDQSWMSKMRSRLPYENL